MQDRFFLCSLRERRREGAVARPGCVLGDTGGLYTRMGRFSTFCANFDMLAAKKTKKILKEIDFGSRHYSIGTPRIFFKSIIFKQILAIL